MGSVNSGLGIFCHCSTRFQRIIVIRAVIFDFEGIADAPDGAPRLSTPWKGTPMSRAEDGCLHVFPLFKVNGAKVQQTRS